ncbi:hypothetical protein BGM26_18535 [Bacillus sp. FJAT-29790]|uniref:hypothetical protein n=1 Tax=Bacillus sp. FJAT-29790 TaxID=1895002 RepID=UPI001C220EF5|nr:hypothetical protein [Bacillus sp. FJAT-29790]MBU8880950.1 hypothetical protein [Bacillus sp. FJAT-29790]
MNHNDPFDNKMKQMKVGFGNLPNAKKIVYVALLSSLAALFQSAGGFLPGVGYFISPLSTAPIIVCAIFSIRFGFFAYVLTALLLLILQPSELIVFPFTTGLLGLAIGVSFHLLHKKLSIIVSGGVGLAIGIYVLLYGFNFPVLGPTVSQTLSFSVVVCVFVFSIFYSWLWVGLSKILIKRFVKFIF